GGPASRQRARGRDAAADRRPGRAVPPVDRGCGSAVVDLRTQLVRLGARRGCRRFRAALPAGPGPGGPTVTAAIALQDVSKRYIKYDDTSVASRLWTRTKRSWLWALRDVDFEIQPGESVGVLGRN